MAEPVALSEKKIATRFAVKGARLSELSGAPRRMNPSKRRASEYLASTPSSPPANGGGVTVSPGRGAGLLYPGEPDSRGQRQEATGNKQTLCKLCPVPICMCVSKIN